MTFKPTVLLTTLLLCASPVAALSAPPTGTLVRLNEAFRIAGDVGPAVWPGFTAEDAPVLLISDEVEFLLNVSAPPEGFEILPDQRFRGKAVFARPRVFPPTLQASFPAIGRETVVVGTASATGLSGPAWVLMVAHELFHVHQATLGFHRDVAALRIGPENEGQWQLDYPFPYGDPAVGGALSAIAGELSGMLGSSTGRACAAVSAAAALHQLLARLASDSSRHRDYLRFVIAKEGTARYFELALARELARSYEPSQEFLRLEGGPAFRDLWRSRYSSLDKELSAVGSKGLSRSDFYTLGLGIALALDELEPGWKQQGESSSLLWVDQQFRRVAAEQKCQPSPASTGAGGAPLY